MQQRRTSVFVTAALLLCIVCAGFVQAKSVAVVGMVTETQGHAYWQNDSKKIRVQELAELPENARLVLAKDSKLVVVYLVSGQQYELKGPALVQFKNSKPVALNGIVPKTIGATPVLTDKKRIDPKSVQTAGQTLVSTEAKADSNMPVAVSAPPPPPPPAPAPPVMMAPSPAPAPAAIETIAAARERERMEAYASAKRAEEAYKAAARQAETAALASQIAEMKAAEAAKSAEHGKEKRGAEPKLEPECPPLTADDSSGLSGVAKCGDIED